MADFLTFKELYERVNRGISAPKGSMQTFVKNVINMVYLNEILVSDDLHPFFWLVDFDDSLASVAPATITAITKADPGVFTTDAAHGLVAGDIISIYGIVGMTELNNRTFKLASADTATTLELEDLDSVDEINTTSLTTYVSGGTIHHRGLTLATTGKSVQRILKYPKWVDEDIMEPISIEDIEKKDKLDDNTARPEFYQHRKSYLNDGTEINQLLWFYGADAAYDLRYWFERRPTRLSATTDVPLLPPQFHDIIVSGAMTRLAENQVQVENAVIWPGLYGAQITQLKAFNRKWWKENQDLGKPYML